MATDKYEKRRMQKRKWQRRNNALRSMQDELLDAQVHYRNMRWSDEWLKERTIQTLESMLAHIDVVRANYAWMIDTLTGE